jgi:hypothetical protein
MLTPAEAGFRMKTFRKLQLIKIFNAAEFSFAELILAQPITTFFTVYLTQELLCSAT